MLWLRGYAMTSKECDKKLTLNQFLIRCTNCRFSGCETNAKVQNTITFPKDVTISCIRVILK